MVAMNN